MKKIITLFLILGFMTLHGDENMVNEHESCDGNHSGHSHNHGIYKKINERKTVTKKRYTNEELLIFADVQRDKLVDEKKIPKSWAQIKDREIMRTKYRFVNDWMVVYKNPQIKNERFQTLYIFVSTYGEFRGVNYTGK